MNKPNFKELRRLAKDRPILLKAINDYEKLWVDEQPNSEVKTNAE